MIKKFMNDEYSFDLRDDVPTDEIVLKEIWEENVYEVHGWHFDKYKTVIDIGANIGAFSIYSLAIGAREVYAIEPEPHNLEALRKNIEINGLSDKVKVLDVGVSDYEGTAVINDMGGGSTIVDDGIFGAEIKVTTLDKIFAKHKIKDVGFLKIDVEGSEPEIILSASKSNLEKCHYIAIEFDIRTGSRIGDIVQKLSETHHVRTMGSWERGGMIWAWLY